MIIIHNIIDELSAQHDCAKQIFYIVGFKEISNYIVYNIMSLMNYLRITKT